MKEKILPCPFCGNDAMFFRQSGYTPGGERKIAVRCSYCGIGFDSMDSKNEEYIIKKWNRRSRIKEQSAIPQQLKEETITYQGEIIELNHEFGLSNRVTITIVMGTVEDVNKQWPLIGKLFELRDKFARFKLTIEKCEEPK